MLAFGSANPAKDEAATPPSGLRGPASTTTTTTKNRDLTTTAALTSTDWKYDAGACRTGLYGKGHGQQGYDYDVHYHKDLEWCKSTCRDSYRCKAFEYYKGDGYKNPPHCEIWYKYPQSAEYKNNFVCYYKPHHAPEVRYDDYSGFCRVDKYQTDAGKKGVHYDVYDKTTYDWCKQKASSNPGYKAFEYHSDNQYCELWKYQPKSYKPDVHGYAKCYIKIY